VPDRCILRIVAALLLAWIAVDLMAIDTCALDVGRRPMPGRSSVVQLDPADPGGASTRPHLVLHQDHCFCHGLSTGAGTRAALTERFLIGRALLGTPSGYLLRVSSALYHPPQLSA
jgi:hypothetical protein